MKDVKRKYEINNNIKVQQSWILKTHEIWNSIKALFEYIFS